MIKITALEKIGDDERGYTYEYFHERMGRHLIIFRKAGTYSGNHYHKGISLGKNPEILILFSGSIVLQFKEVQQSDIESVMISSPTQIEIPPYFWHQIYCQTDSTMLELGSLSEHAADTFTDRNP